MAEKEKNYFIIILILYIIFPNIYLTRKHICYIHKQMEPLRNILGELREAINVERINPQSKVYVTASIVEHLPYLCWDKETGKSLYLNFKKVKEDKLCITERGFPPPYNVSSPFSWEKESLKLRY